MSELPIFESGFTKVPTHLIDVSMPFAAGIPASFWKYLLVLWRDLFGAGCEKRGYKASKTMTQFHMNKETAIQWTGAMSVSGLFIVSYGFKPAPYKKNTPGLPTVFQYRADATLEEWECFIAALRTQILVDKNQHWKSKGNGVEGFRIELSFKVDRERDRRGLPRCWDKWHEQLLKSGVIASAGNGDYELMRVDTDRTHLGAEVGEYGN